MGLSVRSPTLSSANARPRSSSSHGRVVRVACDEKKLIGIVLTGQPHSYNVFAFDSTGLVLPHSVPKANIVVVYSRIFKTKNNTDCIETELEWNQGVKDMLKTRLTSFALSRKDVALFTSFPLKGMPAELKELLEVLTERRQADAQMPAEHCLIYKQEHARHESQRQVMTLIDMIRSFFTAKSRGLMLQVNQRVMDVIETSRKMKASEELKVSDEEYVSQKSETIKIEEREELASDELQTSQPEGDDDDFSEIDF